METHLFKFSACLVIFWLVYVLLLEHQKMHKFKRFYLLGSFAIALIIPLLTITHYIEPLIQDFEIATNYIPMELPNTENPIEDTASISLETILWSIYGLGVLLFSIRFVFNLVKLYRNISSSEKISNRSFIYVLLKEYRIPHSFFRYIFLNKQKFENKDIPKEVLLHEETHAKQLHSLDILVLELIQIVFWFHPLVYILKHHVKLNHEFLADQAVLNNGIDSKNYQNILLQFSSSTQDLQLMSAINYSSFKKRFTVMKTHTSKTRIWLSSILLIPVCGILFYSFANREYVQKENNDSINAITEELKEAEKLNIIYADGATDKLMQEYRDFISKYKRTRTIYGDTYERAVIIYDKIMSDVQRASVEKYPRRLIPESNLSKTKPRRPTKAEFKDFKDASKYAIWIDAKHVSNSVLDNYTVDDFVHITGSIVHKNARSEKFPQPNQYHLYTQKGFKYAYQDAQLRKYKKVTQTYSKAIQTYLKGSQIDNTELRILKAQVDKIYKSFSKEEIKENNILPPPPVPAEKKMTSQNRNSKGGPNFEDTQNIYNPSFLEYIIEMEQLGASFYLDDKKISSEKAIKIAQNSFGKRYEMLTQKDADGNYLVKLFSHKINNAQNPPTKEEIASYNAWAKKMKVKFEKMPESEKVNGNPHMINDETFRYYKSIYNKMTSDQKKNSVSLPEAVLVTEWPMPVATRIQPVTKSDQEKATKKQIAEYNAWAKEINEKMAVAEKKKGNDKWSAYPIIKVKEIEKYKAIYNLMSIVQQKSAEPWPNFSSPPPPPVRAAASVSAPKILELVEEQKLPPPPPPPTPEIIEVVEELPAPPSPPEPEDPLDFIIKMAKKDAKFYYEGKAISSDKAIEIIKKNKKLNINAKESSKNGKPLVFITKKPILIGVKGKDPIIYINKKQLVDPKVSLTKTEIMKLKLTLSDGKITSFKLKIPGIKTDFIKGNSISGTSIKNLENFNEGMITIFDIKDNRNNKIPPIVIELIK